MTRAFSNLSLSRERREGLCRVKVGATCCGVLGVRAVFVVYRIWRRTCGRLVVTLGIIGLFGGSD